MSKSRDPASAILFCVACLALLSGCDAPRLIPTFPQPDRVIVVEDGKRVELERVEIRIWTFPTGGTVEYISEHQPPGDAGSLRRFMNNSPDWRNLGFLSVYVVRPLLSVDPSFRWDRIRILSIHPAILGIACEPIPDGGFHPDCLPRPHEFDANIRFCRLVIAEHFPSEAEARRIAREFASESSPIPETAALMRLLEPRIVELEEPLGFDAALEFVAGYR